MCQEGMKTLVTGQPWDLEDSELGFHAVFPTRVLLGSDQSHCTTHPAGLERITIPNPRAPGWLCSRMGREVAGT